jgi:hypothetical protein
MPRIVIDLRDMGISLARIIDFVYRRTGVGISRFDVPSVDESRILKISKEIMSGWLVFLVSERDETNLFVLTRLNEQARKAWSGQGYSLKRIVQ